MRHVIFTIVSVLVFSCISHAAPTVFFKDGTKEVGSSIWMENDKVYLNSGNELYEYSQDELRLDETLKYNMLGRYQAAAPAGGAVPDGSRRTSKRHKESQEPIKPDTSTAGAGKTPAPVVTAKFIAKAGSRQDSGGTSPEAGRFIKQFRAAITAGDFSSLSEMVNWEGVNEDTRHSVEFALRECMKQPIQEISIGRVPEGTPLEYTVNGTTYRPNLTPIGFLNIKFAQRQKTGQAMITSTGFMVGRSGSKIMIATAAAQ